jgi:uncharacterized protein
MKRKIEQKLLEWKTSPQRKPLLLDGARQVGKTYILEWLGQNHFKNWVRVNLAQNASMVQTFEGDLKPQRIIEAIEASYGIEIYPGETLIILDEIQKSARALMSLKMFCEEAPQYCVAAAGSLLGVKIKKDESIYPVGKVKNLELYPMDMEEFLWATGREELAGQIREHFRDMSAMPEASHRAALEAYRQYLVVGGMPDAVLKYSVSGSIVAAGEAQADILKDYMADTTQYATESESVKIRACYNSIPMQLAKENLKFQYKVVRKGGTATIFGSSLDWLKYAGLIYQCDLVDSAYLPLKAYIDPSDFKIYMNDVGLLAQHSGMPVQLILSEIEMDNTFMGGMTENYVAQALTAAGHRLYYWKNDNVGEVDFVLQSGEGVIPVEVKKSRRTKSVSLNKFRQQYSSTQAIRFSKKNFGQFDDLKAIPLYAVFCLEAYPSTTS